MVDTKKEGSSHALKGHFPISYNSTKFNVDTWGTSYPVPHNVEELQSVYFYKLLNNSANQ